MRLATLLFITLFPLSPVFGVNWLPVDPEHLTLKTPKVDKNADAEAIFWDVRVEDDAQGGSPKSVLSHYIRIKIFTDRGRESQATVSIASAGRTSISNVAGRTIKPDGTILELRKDAVLDKMAAKFSGVKLRTKSFAMPGVEPGAIIEYQWKENRNDQLANYVRLYFQRDIPVWQVRYHVKPLTNPFFPYAMRYRPFQLQTARFVPEQGGFFLATVSDMPAFREEPRMPPEDEVMAWMLIYYSEDKNLQGDKYWQTVGKEVHQNFKSSTKVNDAVRKAAQTAIGDSADPEDKLARLVEYCRTSVKNVRSESAGLTAQEREAAKDNKSPSDTLKHGVGTGYDINMLFAALASAAGFEVRVAKLADRSDKFFERNFLDSYFLRAYDIAVKVGDNWRFFDPASSYVRPGMLRWQEEGVPALICDPKEPVFVNTPMSGPEKSVTRRVAKLLLSDDGTLAGDIEVSYTGHAEVTQKFALAGISPQKREEDLVERIKGRLSTAEVSNVRMEDAADLAKPFKLAYRIKVPGYAQRTGKRLFLQPAFFQRNIGAMFITSERQHPIYFNYPWSEDDEVSIRLPEGWEMDLAEAPSPGKFAQVGSYDVRLGSDGKSLLYTRKLRFGENGSILFAARSYSALKNAFDFVHQQDSHTVSLKQAAAK
jgi:uncharacterized protein DUF3857/transglutaminase superfamily protein